MTPQLSRHYAPHHAHLRSVAMALKEPAAMRVKELKVELTELGVSTADCFEKEDLVSKLEAARLNPPTPAPPAPPASPAPAPAPATSAADRAEVNAMKVKAIKEELTQLGASTAGLFEKSEFVEALLAARVAAAERQANAEAEPTFDPDVSMGETKKMPKVRVVRVRVRVRVRSETKDMPKVRALISRLALTILAARVTRTSPTPPPPLLSSSRLIHTNPTLHPPFKLARILTRRASSSQAAWAAWAAWVAWAACQAVWVAWAG